MSRTTIADKSADRKYFIITPQLVWALSRDTYDYTFWNVVKMIAGDHGECTLATPDLATLAMMSRGKAHDCRTYLLDIGLLEGEIEQDPGYPQPVWHLRIPDLWPRNIAWRETLGHKLKARIELKRLQKAEGKKSVHVVNAEERSCGERGHTPHEQGPTPGEQGPTPGETKKNQKENQKGEQDLPLFCETEAGRVEI